MESWLGSVETRRVELADKKSEIFISKVMAAIGEETGRNPSETPLLFIQINLELS